MRKIIGETYNSDIKQFYCKHCKKGTNIIYKDDNGESYCDCCVKNIEKSLDSIEEEVVEEKVEVQKVEEKVDKTDQKPVRHRKRSKTSSSHRGERKLF